jgi:hypothetical protein
VSFQRIHDVIVVELFVVCDYVGTESHGREWNLQESEQSMEMSTLTKQTTHLSNRNSSIRGVGHCRIFLKLHANLENQQTTTHERDHQRNTPQKLLDEVKVSVDDVGKSMD